jgi:hypothetical protein
MEAHLAFCFLVVFARTSSSPKKLFLLIVYVVTIVPVLLIGILLRNNGSV